MSQNWLRQCYLSLSGTSTKVVSGGGQNDLRIRFQTLSHTQQELGSAEIIVTNQSRETVAKVQNEFTKVELYAGYQDNTGLLFSGEITVTQSGERENGTDGLLRIWARDRNTAYNQSTVNTTLAAGSTPQTIVDTCLKAMQPHGVSMGLLVGVDLSTPKFPRGYVLAGMARDFLREVATSKQATFDLTGGKLNIVAKGAPTPGSPIALNSATGLVGWPIVRPEGVIITCLINPAIQVHSMVQVDAGSLVAQKVNNGSLSTADATLKADLGGLGAADGVYRVLHIRTEGDTRGPPWIMELTCLGAYTGTGNTVQTGLGYV